MFSLVKSIKYYTLLVEKGAVAKTIPSQPHSRMQCEHVNNKGGALA